MPFDFDAAVTAPFRMQPGLRRMQRPGDALTPLAPGSRHQREKLAVLSRFWRQALVADAQFDALPSLKALMQYAAQTRPQAWQWDGQSAHALQLAVAVDLAGKVTPTAPGSFGLGDEVERCLQGLPPSWRQTGLLSLAFAEDVAIVDGQTGRIPWLAVTLPSHWAPETKVGQHFAQVHAPVADNALLIKASQMLVQLVCGPDAWERFVWNITDQPRLHAHPARTDRQRWHETPVHQAYWRCEHQSFIPLPALQQAVFAIHVQVQGLASVLGTAAARWQSLHDAVASMSTAVLAYRGLQEVREPLLAWLAAGADDRRAAGPGGQGGPAPTTPDSRAR